MADPSWVRALAVLSLISANGCADRSAQTPSRAAQAAAEVRAVEARVSPRSREFTGRVPRLGAPPRDTLRIVREYGDTSMFAIPTAVQSVGRFLVVSDRFMDPHLAVFDTESGKLLRRLGRQGKGPREFLDPSWFLLERGRREQVWVYDFSARRFTLLDLASEDRPFARELSMEVGASLSAPIWHDGRIISNGLFPDYTLLSMTDEGRPIARIAADPPFSPARMAHPTGRRLLNRSFLTANPSRTRLALTYQWKSRIDFFTIDGERIGSVQGPRETTAVFRVADGRFFWGADDENEMAYWQVDATERYVYALFCGCLPGEGNMPQSLHVFDWNGDFVAEVGLDRQVTSLDVTDDDRMLYGTVEAPYPGVGQWRLPDWLAGRVAAGSTLHATAGNR